MGFALKKGVQNPLSQTLKLVENWSTTLYRLLFYIILKLMICITDVEKGISIISIELQSPNTFSY